MKKPTLSCVVLASGRGKRFQGNKLLAPFGGRPMAQTVLERLAGPDFGQVAVVTPYPQVAGLARALGFLAVDNPDGSDDVAVTIRLGLAALEGEPEGCLFSVCDQPLLRRESLERLAAAFRARPDRITALAYQGQRGNPVIFPRSLFGELAALEPHQSGGTVIARHPELLQLVQAEDPRELMDVDFPGDLEALSRPL